MLFVFLGGYWFIVCLIMLGGYFVGCVLVFVYDELCCFLCGLDCRRIVFCFYCFLVRHAALWCFVCFVVVVFVSVRLGQMGA